MENINISKQIEDVLDYIEEMQMNNKKIEEIIILHKWQELINNMSNYVNEGNDSININFRFNKPKKQRIIGINDGFEKIRLQKTLRRFVIYYEVLTYLNKHLENVTLTYIHDNDNNTNDYYSYTKLRDEFDLEDKITFKEEFKQIKPVVRLKEKR